MATENPPKNPYDKIRPRLHKRIGRELRLAGRVLDLGCGTCELVQYLARTYHQHVTGVDISGGGFPKRRYTSDGRRFRCIRKNARNLEFIKDGVQDAMISMWALHEMEHPEAILKEAYRALRPGGEILIVDFPRDSVAQRLWNEDYYCAAEINQMLIDAGFAEVSARLIERQRIIWAKGFRPTAEKRDERTRTMQ
jgi:ubiquinone/menaquinone biosynthesis C-methylase UbiE